MAGPQFPEIRRLVIVTAAVVAGIAVVIVAGIVAVDEWYGYRRRADQTYRTAYRPGPFRQTDYLVAYLARLPDLSALAPDGFRFVARAELDGMTYAAAFRPGPDATRASGVLIIDDEPYGRPSTRKRYHCTLRLDSYRTFVWALAERAGDFKGDDDFGTDGTSIAIERVLNGKVTSGGGNFIEPYRGLGEIMLARLREGCPGAPLPEIGEDWYLRPTQDRPIMSPPPPPPAVAGPQG